METEEDIRKQGDTGGDYGRLGRQGETWGDMARLKESEETGETEGETVDSTLLCNRLTATV